MVLLESSVVLHLTSHLFDTMAIVVIVAGMLMQGYADIVYGMIIRVVITFSRLGINRVWLPILLVVS